MKTRLRGKGRFVEENALHRLLAGIERDSAGCWLWTGSIVRTGYGQMWFNGGPMHTHRASWTIHNGAIPDGLFVLHKCDVRRCVNPAHLFLGTAADNMQDARAKGRNIYGERHPFAKVTEDQVRAIRAAPNPRTAHALFPQLGYRTISDIRHRKHWTHVK